MECHNVKYCSVDCLQSNWADHKPFCKPQLKLSVCNTPAMMGCLVLQPSPHFEAETSTSVSGSSLLEKKVLSIPSPFGYIEGVRIFDSKVKMKYVALSRVHKQAIAVIFGHDSLQLLEDKKAITIDAWMISGGKCLETYDSLKDAGLLHEVTSILH